MGKYAPLVLLVLAAARLPADRLTLRDGTVIHGDFVSGTPEQIVFQDHNGVRRRFDMQKVREIDFSTLGTPRAATDATRRRDEEQGSEDRTGSFIAVRDDEAIDPQITVAGQTFAATVLDDIRDGNGNVIIPGGSPAAIMVRPVAKGGEPGFAIELVSVVIDGSRYAVYGGAIAAGERKTGEDGASADAEDARRVIVAGPRIQVPAATVLEFRLEQPLLLRQATQ
jgi:hypothetical protein